MAVPITCVWLVVGFRVGQMVGWDDRGGNVQPSYGLTDEQVENMLFESFDYAEEDFRQRQIIEARREADTLF